MKKPQRVAIIDCGTNTFNILVAEYLGDTFRFLHRSKRVVKLGSAGIASGWLNDTVQDRAIRALTSFREICEKYRVSTHLIVGTAAIRDAKNGPAFIRRVKKETAFNLKAIDGLREAELIFRGVKAALPPSSTCDLIMDIGGGSVEFIIAKNGKIQWKRSFRIGAARIKEQVIFSDPIKPTQIKACNTFFEDSLQKLFEAVNQYKPNRLVGSSGSFDTFAACILHSQGKKHLLKGKNYYPFHLPDYNKLHRQLCQSTYKERLHMPGMLRMRAEMIVPASLLLTFVLRKCALKEMVLSTYSLKEGLLTEFLSDKKETNG